MDGAKNTERPFSSRQFNARLPKMTHTQINELTSRHGLTKTQVIILAVDRFARALRGEESQEIRDVRRLKTVARILPEVDLGQEE